MWSRADFEVLIKAVPLPIFVDWDARPSAAKYGHVNSLLAVLRVLGKLGATFTTPQGATISRLTVAPVKRKLTDGHKQHFAIVGHETANPIAVGVLGELYIDVYFNHHLFVEVETTYRQYFPSASVILRPRNFLECRLVPSPGSWGSDIIGMTYDWAGLFILEAVYYDLAGVARRNFRGYKLVPASEKHFLAPNQPGNREARFLENNGFVRLICGANVETCWPALLKEVTRYVREQTGRLNSRKGGA